MTSIMTNASAMTALKSLQMTNKALDTVQSRISTGLRVSEASDNAAYWSIATTMRSDNKALSTVQDALGLGAAKLDVAYTGMNKAIDVVDEIKAKLVAAREPGVDRNKIQAEIAQLQQQLVANAGAASFSGQNWLTVDSSDSGYSSTKSIVSSFTRAADGSVSVSTIEIDIESSKLIDASTLDEFAKGRLDSTRLVLRSNLTTAETTDHEALVTAHTAARVAYEAAVAAGVPADIATTSAALTAAATALSGSAAVQESYSVITLDIASLTDSAEDMHELESYITGVDATLMDMTTAASDLGAAKKRVDLQADFVSSLRDAIDRGVGKLVDADMNAESTRLQALQVQQQLGIQSLSIANSSAQGILALFGR